MKMIKVHTVYSKEEVSSTDDIKILFDEIEISSNGISLVPKEKVLKYGDFTTAHNTNQVIKENYDFNGTSLVPEEGTVSFIKVKDSEFDSLKVENPPNTKSLTELFKRLSETNSRIIFEEKFYQSQTGGIDFSLFVPNFEGSSIKANDLIISNKKFNIVLNSTLKGGVHYEGVYSETVRFHPFKIVKFGKAVHETILVVENENNSFIKDYGTEASSGVYEIKLGELPFYDPNIKVNLETLIVMKSLHNHYKAKSKGFARVLQLMKDKLKTNGSFESLQWYRGEALNDEYISDKGTDTLEVWFRGHKTSISLTRLFNELDLLGGPMEALLLKYSQSDSLSASEESIKFREIYQEICKELLKTDTINSDENIMLLTYLESSLTEGESLRERYFNLMEVYNEENSIINEIELSLLMSRHKLLQLAPETSIMRNHGIMNLGSRVNVTKDTVTLKSKYFQTLPLSIKRGIVDTAYVPSESTESNENILTITSDIEGI